MQTIPMAMTWELLARGRWGILAATLGAIAFPLLIFMSLRQIGGLLPDDRSILILHVVLVLFNATACGAAVYSAQGQLSQLYAYPVRTSALVAWRMFPAMALIALQIALSIQVLNAMFDLGWPVWGPVLFVAVAFAAVQSVVWLTENSVGWMLAALAIVAAMLGLWFKSRYGPTFAADPTGYWQEVTFTEGMALIAVAALAFWIAVKGVARNRRGEAPLSLGIVDWALRYWNSAPALGKRLSTPLQAQRWLEWRQKGWAIPTVVSVGSIVGLTIWLFDNGNPEDLFQGVIAGGGMLTFVGFIGGFFLGNVAQREGENAMGSFLATRPMSSSDMARTVLENVAKSVLLAWAIWATTCLIAYAILMTSGNSAEIRLPEIWGRWYFPATLLGLWTAAAVTASLWLMGRSRLVAQLICGLIAAFVVATLLSKFALADRTRLILGQACLTAVGAAILLGTAWLFAAAHRRTLIQTTTLGVAVGVWLIATVLVMLQPPLPPESSRLAYLLIAATLALSIAPLAAAPLAVAWNRHR